MHNTGNNTGDAAASFDDTSSRSAAMELLSSLRESLNRSDAGLDFRASPTAGGSRLNRTPVRHVPNVDIVSSRMTSKRMEKTFLRSVIEVDAPPKTPPSYLTSHLTSHLTRE
jgi:hypothetical protein